MNFPSNQHASELLEVFFESADEILEGMNRAGLALEANPGDVKHLRHVRRAVHTLKGDSAACGFRELSELAHRLEDVLTPEVAGKNTQKIAEVVLAATDSFQQCLAAHRRNEAPPASNSLRELINDLLREHENAESPPSQAKPEWTEYERLLIEEANRRGERVCQVSVRLTLESQAIGFELARKALESAGRVIALQPKEFVASATASWVHAALATPVPTEHLKRRCSVPSIVAEVAVEILDVPAPASAASHGAANDALQVLLEAEAAATTRTLPSTPRAIPQPSETSSLRVEPVRIDSVMNLVGELIIGKSMLQRAVDDFGRRYPKDPLRGKFSDALSFQSRVLGELQKSVMKIRMVPVEQLFRRFPRIVRDVARLRNKEIALEVRGQNTDLDKSILDTLAEPVAHLVRNSADHGIESTSARKTAGKPARGMIRLSAYHEGDQVVIEVADDGCGLDKERILQRAIERGIVTPNEAQKLSDSEAQQLIFRAGLSTAEEITEISGRGVGLDVVKSVLENLKGSIEVHSEHGRGTTFRLLVPLTLASIQALLFNVNERLYAVPIASVVEITRVAEGQIHRIEGREVFQLRHQLLTLMRLEQLEPVSRNEHQKRTFVIVIGTGARRFGLAVDKLMGEEELVIKALEDQLVTSPLISGASILGDGTVVLILNVSALVSQYTKAVPAGAMA
ncbi:MAG TPA: chemotaxis protein CheA [Candidatus Acidoferrales bacterium]|nr:chemotaxis protein CheA [Candidatus Acidoferrales bacterium]